MRILALNLRSALSVSISAFCVQRLDSRDHDYNALTIEVTVFGVAKTAGGAKPTTLLCVLVNKRSMASGNSCIRSISNARINCALGSAVHVIEFSYRRHREYGFGLQVSIEMINQQVFIGGAIEDAAYHASYVIGCVNKLAQRGILAAGVILAAILYPRLKCRLVISEQAARMTETN